MKRVLVSDPEPGLVRAYRAALEREGYSTEGAEDGLRCLERLAHFRPDLLVLELDLPWGGGEGILACLGEGALPAPSVLLLGRGAVRRRLTCPEEWILARFDKPLTSIRLAQAVADHFASRAPAAQPTGGGPASDRVVLLVEDDATNRKLLRDILEIEFLVVEADSAEAAWKMLKRVSPDLILLDIALPGQCGLSFKDELALHPALAGVPVVALSADAMPDQVEEGNRHGFAEYITKPVLEDPFAFAARLALLCR